MGLGKGGPTLSIIVFKEYTFFCEKLIKSIENVRRLTLSIDFINF